MKRMASVLVLGWVVGTAWADEKDISKPLENAGFNCPNITDEGIARLQKALPKCEIIR
jgi:hypothetical protein